MPFLIAWGDTPHPGTVLPDVGRLTSLAVTHPDANGVRGAFEQLGVDVPVAAGPTAIEAEIETHRGQIRIR